MTRYPQETIVERTVSYTLFLEDKLIVIENVPARVCLETGEQLFAPETVEKLQALAWGDKEPQRTIETPVYDFGRA
jgi:YgiT-type zinc finger domain-containing protein